MATFLSIAQTAARTAEAAAKVGDVATAKTQLEIAQQALNDAISKSKELGNGAVLAGTPGPFQDAVLLSHRVAAARDRALYAVQRAERRAARNAR
jgi:hypothetical protein